MSYSFDLDILSCPSVSLFNSSLKCSFHLSILALFSFYDFSFLFLLLPSYVFLCLLLSGLFCKSLLPVLFLWLFQLFHPFSLHLHVRYISPLYSSLCLMCSYLLPLSDRVPSSTFCLAAFLFLSSVM